VLQKKKYAAVAIKGGQRQKNQLGKGHASKKKIARVDPLKERGRSSACTTRKANRKIGPQGSRQRGPCSSDGVTGWTGCSTRGERKKAGKHRLQKARKGKEGGKGKGKGWAAYREKRFVAKRGKTRTRSTRSIQPPKGPHIAKLRPGAEKRGGGGTPSQGDGLPGIEKKKKKQNRTEGQTCLGVWGLREKGKKDNPPPTPNALKRVWKNLRA